MMRTFCEKMNKECPYSVDVCQGHYYFQENGFYCAGPCSYPVGEQYCQWNDNVSFQHRCYLGKIRGQIKCGYLQYRAKEETAEDRLRQLRHEKYRHYSLFRLGKENHAGLEDLRGMVSSDCSWVWLKAIEALGKLGDGANSAVPDLLAFIRLAPIDETQESSHFDSRRKEAVCSAIHLVVRISPDSAEVLSTLEGIAGESRYAVQIRKAAWDELNRLGRVGNIVNPNPEEDYRRRCATKKWWQFWR